MQGQARGSWEEMVPLLLCTGCDTWISGLPCPL